jgi:hypothetical protein
MLEILETVVEKYARLVLSRVSEPHPRAVIDLLPPPLLVMADVRWACARIHIAGGEVHPIGQSLPSGKL